MKLKVCRSLFDDGEFENKIYKTEHPTCVNNTGTFAEFR